MGSAQKLLTQILMGTSDANIRFSNLCHILSRLGFEMRVSGSHHIFRMLGVEEKINLQKDGNKAKPYQVKQVRNVILKYKLGGEINGQV
ncbi:MAG: type II toxin-antitoxin system HicA family toxin [Kiritimatiellae bacterium]|nr:type II toxin-antitoxin system HicA family toxin [Kiritimatiellia bacterium]MDD5522779.1 type II toxin-antitoxin system HicA family toxin [Kiritimatiellia bacterium]